MKIWKTILQSFKECLFFVLCLFCFLFLSNNTIHVIFYTYICYWNTFQYKYIIQITFHVVKQSHARVTSKDICLFTLYHIVSLPISVLSQFRSQFRSSPPSLFNRPHVRLYLKVPNNMYVLKRSIHCLIYFVFIECLCMHLFCQIFGGNSRDTQNLWYASYKLELSMT